MSPDYEAYVRTPALSFIAAMDRYIKMMSPHYEALPKKVGGSLMRIHRDVRFSADKSPYKTNIGIQFRHELGKDVHAPGFYLHIEPNECFVGVGVWHPAPDALSKIRDRMVEKPDEFKKAINHKPFKDHFELAGESLIRPPKGFEKDHPLIEHLKRKDFITGCNVEPSVILEQDLPKQITGMFGKAQPLMRFLCAALELNY